MELESKQISKSKIEAFLRILPFLKEKYGNDNFDVNQAIRRVNANPEYKVWCYKTNKMDPIRKKAAIEDNSTPLDLQETCHYFAARGKSKIVDLETGKPCQLLDYIDTMIYKIK